MISALVPTAVLLATQAHALEPNGTGTYSELGSELYVGTLFLDSSSQSPAEILSEEQAKRMEIRFSDDMSRRSWTQYWTQSIAINSPREDLVASGDEMSQVLSAFKGDMKYGDQVELIYRPADGTSLVVNGTTLASDKSARLFNLFLSAWIGPVPPSSDFKSAVLGRTDSENAYSRFLNLAPDEARIAVVEAWGEPDKQSRTADSMEEPPSQPRQSRSSGEQSDAPRQPAEPQQTAEQQQADKQEQAQQRQAQREAERRAAEEAARRKAEAEKEAARREEQLAGLSVEGVSQRKEPDEQIDLSVEAILAQQDYTTSIITKIYQSVSYPRSSINRNQEGSVRANVVISRDGSVQNVQLVEASEYDLLNQATRDAIEDAAPFPPIPEAVQEDSLEMLIPVSFKLN